MNSIFAKQKCNFRRFCVNVVVISSVIVFCCLALYVAGLFPQSSVRRGLQESANVLEREGFGPHVFNMAGSSSVVDNYTENIILSSSFYMDTRMSPDVIFSNPFVVAKEDSLKRIAYGDVKPGNHYTRYWQGFRSFVRPLLALSDYGTIRLLINVLFNILFAVNLVMLRKYLGVRDVLSFALSIILLNVATISSNVQHSMVFLIALFSVLVLVIWKRQIVQNSFLFFSVIGIFTQYYDFYTAPVVTFGYPMVVMLLLLRQDKEWTFIKRGNHIVLVFISFLSWLFGYAGMWFVKMILTTIFTSYDGFESAINAFAFRTGIKKNAFSYSVLQAFVSIFISLFQTKANAIIICAIGVLIVIGAAYRLLAAKAWDCWVQRNAALLVVSILPLVWYAMSAQPTIAHSYFQYRSLGVTVFSLLCASLDAYSYKYSDCLHK